MPEIASLATVPADSTYQSETRDSSSAKWYALTVRHQHERRTARTLTSLGWETLVPLYRSRRQWTDRVKEVDLPLFTGYVLCRFTAGERMRIEDTPGVAAIVSFAGEPAPLLDSEIHEIRRIAASSLRLIPWPHLRSGDLVRLDRGPLRGLQGTLLSHRGQHRLVVGVELLRRSIAVEIEPDMITPL